MRALVKVVPLSDPNRPSALVQYFSSRSKLLLEDCYSDINHVSNYDMEGRMNNRVTASIEFSFKGETKTLRSEVDIDALMGEHGEMPALNDLIARHNGYDPYSYEYDVILSEEVVFEYASGPIADFIEDGALDVEAFDNFWDRNFVDFKLQDIASRHLGCASLADNPALKAALKEAWDHGMANAPKNRDHKFL